jgi:hypothetical protein
VPAAPSNRPGCRCCALASPAGSALRRVQRGYAVEVGLADESPLQFLEAAVINALLVAVHLAALVNRRVPAAVVLRSMLARLTGLTVWPTSVSQVTARDPKPRAFNARAHLPANSASAVVALGATVCVLTGRTSSVLSGARWQAVTSAIEATARARERMGSPVNN